MSVEGGGGDIFEYDKGDKKKNIRLLLDWEQQRNAAACRGLRAEKRERGVQKLFTL